MNQDKNLLNPQGELLSDVERRLKLARKARPIWAKRLAASQLVQTLEGPIQASAGDCLCRGVVGELWAQSESRLREKYLSSGVVDEDGWERFDPSPDAAPIEAAKIDTGFQVDSHFGKLNGKAGDYVIRSTSDHSDVWIVAHAIFEASYEMVQNQDAQPPRLEEF